MTCSTTWNTMKVRECNLKCPKILHVRHSSLKLNIIYFIWINISGMWTVLKYQTKPCIKEEIASNSSLSMCWLLKTLSFLIWKPTGWNQHRKSTASFSTETWHCGTLKCCSAFSGFHAQWLLRALALKAISAPSGVKLAWIYKSFKAVDWICTPDKG